MTFRAGRAAGAVPAGALLVPVDAPLVATGAVLVAEDGAGEPAPAGTRLNGASPVWIAAIT